MSYLVYCIFRTPLPAALEIPDGVAGSRVFNANYSGLGAALSKLPGSHSLPDTRSLDAYERVVESFNRHLTVIPMRYGCRVGCPYDAVMLLRENHDAYASLLRRLDGLPKIGKRVLPGKPLARAETYRPAFLRKWFPTRTQL